MFRAIREDGPNEWDVSPNDSLRGVKLGIPRPYFFDRLQPDVQAAVERAIGALAELGAEIVDVVWSEADAAAAAGFVICRPELAAVHERALQTTPELFGSVLRSRLEAFSLFPGRAYLHARRARTVLRQSIADLYRRHDLIALVTPTVPATATAADALAISYPDGEEPIHSGFTRFTMPFNTTGQPALSLPCGFDREGLPIGLQIVGRPYEDAKVCWIGQVFERATTGDHRRPSL
jgi:aspartyl-tRNA(Asn)/glutamyl-tRNA(Gln) amidotransferase subunit A